MLHTDRENRYGPWNPGLRSKLPRAYQHLATLYRPENTFTGADEARDLSDFCGLPVEQLVRFRPSRLLVHELLVRVTADVSVPDGPDYADLGINFRCIATLIFERYISARVPEIEQKFEEMRARAETSIAAESDRLIGPGAATTAEQPASLWSRLIGRSREPVATRVQPQDPEATLQSWRERLSTSTEAEEAACLKALLRTVTAISGRHGRLVGDADVIARIATTLVLNDFGSRHIGAEIEPLIGDAAANGDIELLPAQDKPVVMNVKGASASGKSTMRPLQKALAERLDVPWSDFALISPDIWRKYLLDYDSLGEAYKYAGTMTGHELEIIDKKLDHYMAEKASRGRMSHLLIDRFRFDSFVAESDREEGSNLLTRFGELVYIFFMITPPDATVERAWERGLKFGRYKAVDDLLDHNVEAYSGMPGLFFTWALSTDKRVHFEFLDNSVAKNSTPRTVAFGWNREMNILDVATLMDIDRFRNININADAPEDVYPEGADAPERNLTFLRQCADRMPVVNFADYETGAIYARLEAGKPVWVDTDYVSRIADSRVRSELEALGVLSFDAPVSAPHDLPELNDDRANTLGHWGQTVVSTE